MKKTLFSITTLGLVTLSTIRADAQNLYIGARIGANLANQKAPYGAFAPSYDAQDKTNGMHAGFLAGLQMDYYFSDTWGISGELFFDQKGSHVNFHSEGEIGSPTGPFFSETGTSDMTLNYLEFSLLLKARFGSGDIQPYVFAGPSVGLFLSGKQHDNITNFESGEYSTFDTTQSVPISSPLPGLDLKKFDVSIVGGAGVDYKLGSGQILFLDASYAYGITTIAQSSDAMIWAKSRDIRIAAGILFPLD